MFKFRSDPIAERVKQVVSDQLGVPKRKIKPHHEFVEDLGADEEDVFELMQALEDEFYIVIPTDDHAISTVEQAVDYVKMELAKQTEDAEQAEYEAEQAENAEQARYEVEQTEHTEQAENTEQADDDAE